jgi:hypothetical protein
MKKLLAALLLVPTILTAQPSVWWESSTITTNTRGTSISKNDTIALVVKMNPNFSSIRSIYFDFQHQKDAIQFLSVEKGAGIPQAASFSVQNYFYPNCKFNRSAQNTTNNGYNNWMASNYTCNAQTVLYHAINRVMVNVASSANLDQATYVTLKFQITNTTAGFPYDSVYMNFAVGYDAGGNIIQTTQMSGAKGVWIQLNSNANNLVSGNVKHGANISSGLQGMMKLSITDTLTQPTEASNTLVGTSGNFGFGQQLQPTTWYRMRLMIPADSVASVSKAATTISDYTAAVQEFITQNLDRTFKNTNINAGIKYWAADVNMNGEFDGGDVQKIFNAVVGLDTIVKAPAGCSANCFVTLPTIRNTVYDTLGFTAWKTLANPYYTQLQTSTAEQVVNLRYVFKGDVNLSHSSIIGATANEAAAIRAASNVAYVSTFGNFVVPNAPSIDVSLNNSVVTSNNVSIPFTVDTKTTKLTGLQFEVKYDPTKVKFEKMEVNTPSWVTFVNNNDGVIRFGAVDKDLKNTLSGSNLVPFKLVFSSVSTGVDLNTSVQIYPTMDATDDKGNQVGINFNTTVIKLIGANFFKNP